MLAIVFARSDTRTSSGTLHPPVLSERLMSTMFCFCSGKRKVEAMSDEPDDRLVFDIAYALSRQRKALRATPDHDGVEHLASVARGVIRHLALCGWRLSKRPEAPMHSTHPQGRHDPNDE